MHPGPVRRRSRWPKAPSCPTLRLVILADLRCSWSTGSRARPTRSATWSAHSQRLPTSSLLICPG